MLWLLGFAVFHIGSLIHLVLVIAVIVVVVRLIQGRKVL
ncbi:MAG TPA: lmo0937 family membrane protein [bacterium]